MEAIKVQTTLEVRFSEARGYSGVFARVYSGDLVLWECYKFPRPSETLAEAAETVLQRFMLHVHRSRLLHHEVLA